MCSKPLLLQVWAMSWQQSITGSSLEMQNLRIQARSADSESAFYKIEVMHMHNPAWETLLKIHFYIILINLVNHNHFLQQFWQHGDEILREITFLFVY